MATAIPQSIEKYIVQSVRNEKIVFLDCEVLFLPKNFGSSLSFLDAHNSVEASDGPAQVYQGPSPYS